MEINFLAENSGDVAEKIRSVTGEIDKINKFFNGKNYSSNLNYLLIRILCLSPRQEDLFPPLPPRYNAGARNYMYRGERLEKPAASFEFDLRLNHAVYTVLGDIRSEFAKNLIDSLAVIMTNKKIRDFDMSRFRTDMVECMNQLGWGNQ